MSVLLKKCSILTTKELVRNQCAAYSKQWPDEKWMIMNGLRRFGSWWQRQLDNMDLFCCQLSERYPNMPPPSDPDSKLETIKNNLQLQAIKYWMSRGFCIIRGQVVTIQAMDWHINTHNFIMTSIRGSISSTKSFLERNLLDEIPPPSQANSGQKESATQSTEKSDESCKDVSKSENAQK